MYCEMSIYSNTKLLETRLGIEKVVKEMFIIEESGIIWTSENLGLRLTESNGFTLLSMMSLLLITQLNDTNKQTLENGGFDTETSGNSQHFILLIMG